MSFRSTARRCAVGAILLVMAASADAQVRYALRAGDASSPRVVFGITELEAALVARGARRSDNAPSLVVALDRGNPAAVAAEGFTIQVQQDAPRTVHITSADDTGLMYGLLDLAETVRYRGIDAIASVRQQPRIAFRCIKFNLPWDAYTPAAMAQMNAEPLKDIEFWRGFLDEMARNRFNKLSLWALHPFPYMVKLDKYPEAAIAQGAEMQRWLDFWQKLFQMADDRGIQIYIATWNTFVSPPFAQAHGLKQRSRIDSPLVRDYMRESVRALVDTYPNLGGIITTASEEMAEETRNAPGGNERFVVDTYIAGLNQAKRKVDFVYRSWWGGAKVIRKEVMEPPRYAGPLFMDIKFNVSHGHSHPAVHFEDPDLWNPVPTTYKMIWHVRNEDFYLTRWGDPGFVRSHVKLNERPWAAGYFVGSERATPGIDFYSRDPQRMPWKWRYVKEGLFWKLWGRLLYDPRHIQLRICRVPGRPLRTAGRSGQRAA